MAHDNPNTKRESGWGIIKKLTGKDFGFIASEGQIEDIFFHSSEMVGIIFDEIEVGVVVHFDIAHFDIKGKKWLAAVKVKRNGGPHLQAEMKIITLDSLTPSDPGNTAAIEFFKSINDTLVQRLRRNPDDLYRLHPKVFEDLIVEIFKSEGYVTELIQSWNQADGGVDIIAVRRDIAGFQVRYAIQCKRYAAARKITAEPIRALAGVLDRFQAHVGVVATTSFFTKPAREEVEGHLWKISLRDFENIVAALKKLELLRQ